VGAGIPDDGDDSGFGEFIRSYLNEKGLTINVTAFVDLAYGTKVFSVVTSVATQPWEAVTSVRGLPAEFAGPILLAADLIARSATQLKPPDTALGSRLRGLPVPSREILLGERTKRNKRRKVEKST